MTHARRTYLAIAAGGVLVAAIASCEKPPEKSVTASGHQVNNAAYWDGAVWFVETEGKLAERSGASARSWLIRLPAAAGQAPRKVTELSVVEPWLLAGSDRLWIFSSTSTGYYKDGQLASHSLSAPLERVSRPFTYRGRPALIACEPPGYRLKVYEDGAWQPAAQLRMKLPNESDDCSGEYLQAFECDGELHVFCQVPLAAPVYHHRGLPLEDADQTWENVADAGGQWKAACVGGKPAIFFHTDRNGLAVLGLMCREGQWTEFFSRGIGLDIGLGLCPTGPGEDFILLRRILPLGVKVLGVEKGRPAWAYESEGETNLVRLLTE